jgi:hypothetical protein
MNHKIIESKLNQHKRKKFTVFTPIESCRIKVKFTT